MTFQQTIQNIKTAITTGGSASDFMSEAFISYYRTNSKKLVSLSGFHFLDSTNKQLFIDMLKVRQMNGCSEDELFKLELVAKKNLGILPE